MILICHLQLILNPVFHLDIVINYLLLNKLIIHLVQFIILLKIYNNQDKLKCNFLILNLVKIIVKDLVMVKEMLSIKPIKEFQVLELISTKINKIKNINILHQILLLENHPETFDI